MNKRHSFKGLCVVVAMLIAGISAQAQRFETSAYFNGILPVREFNDAVQLQPYGYFVPMNRTNIATSASAGLGFTARFGVWFDVGYGQLLPFGEASFLWNSTKASVRDIYDNNSLNDSLRSTPKYPNYFNIPVLIGLKYRYEITPIIKPFAEMAIGYDLMFISINGYKKGTGLHYSYKPSGALAWSIGGGTYLGDNVSVGLYFMNLGEHRMVYTSWSDKSEDESYSVEKRKIGEIGLRIGFHF